MNELGLKLAAQFLRSAEPQELLRFADALFPALIANFSPQERVQFLRNVIQNHLETLLQDVGAAERTTLLAELLPTLSAVFQLDAEARNALLASMSAQ